MCTYIFFIYRFRSLPGIEALIYTDSGRLWAYWVQSINQSINQMNTRRSQTDEEATFLSRYKYKHLNQLQRHKKT